MKDTFSLIGRIHITIQICLWNFAIYNCTFNILPYLKMNFVLEFLLTICLTFHVLCFCRNFYMVIFKESYIDQEKIGEFIKEGSIEKLILQEEEKICMEFPNDYLEVCKKCDILRFKRSHHCSICNRCVEMMDHHCIVLNSCIGKRNYKYFLSYLFLIVMNSFFVFSLSSWSIYNYNQEAKEKNYNSLEFYLYFPFKIGCNFIISLCTYIFVGYFFIYHMYLVYNGVTSLEIKYGLNRNKTLNKNENSINNSFKNNFVEKKFLYKFKILYTNLLQVLESKSVLDIYWPE